MNSTKYSINLKKHFQRNSFSPRFATTPSRPSSIVLNITQFPCAHLQRRQHWRARNAKTIKHKIESFYSSFVRPFCRTTAGDTNICLRSRSAVFLANSRRVHKRASPGVEASTLHVFEPGAALPTPTPPHPQNKTEKDQKGRFRRAECFTRTHRRTKSERRGIQRCILRRVVAKAEGTAHTRRFVALPVPPSPNPCSFFRFAIVLILRIYYFINTFISASSHAAICISCFREVLVVVPRKFLPCFRNNFFFVRYAVFSLSARGGQCGTDEP